MHRSVEFWWRSFKGAGEGLIKILRQVEPTTRSGGTRIHVDGSWWTIEFEKETNHGKEEGR